MEPTLRSQATSSSGLRLITGLLSGVFLFYCDVED